MLARASSCVGNSWCHAMFKIKYCHKIFANKEIRSFVAELFFLISATRDIPIRTIGFDDDHVHPEINIKLRSKPEVAKIFKGIIGKKIFENFPEIKKRFFWGSGFWNPAYLMDNIGSNEEHVREYIKNQKYSI
jgi:putative transposase